MNQIYSTAAKLGDTESYLFAGAAVILITLACIVVYIIETKAIIKMLAGFITKNQFKWGGFLLKRRAFQRLALIPPAIIVYEAAFIFEKYQNAIQKTAITFIYVLSTIIISAILDSADDTYRTHPISNVRPIKGLIQVVKIIIYIVAGVVVIANIMDKSPLILLSGIGALTAIFSLVFKDSILGFVAGIQLTSNDMLRIGDWIEMPKYGADGFVTDILLNTNKPPSIDKKIDGGFFCPKS